MKDYDSQIWHQWSYYHHHYHYLYISVNKEDLALHKASKRNGIVEKRRYEEDSDDSDNDQIEISKRREQSDGGKAKRKSNEDSEDDDVKIKKFKHSKNKEVCITTKFINKGGNHELSTTCRSSIIKWWWRF